MKRPETKPIVLAIPTPPSVNHLFANVPGRGRMKQRRYKEWLIEAGWSVKLQKIGHIGGKVSVEIGVERQRSSDIDNRLKAVLDLLVSMGVIDDDRHVEKITAEWRDDIKGCIVTVRPA